jgi:putative transposase
MTTSPSRKGGERTARIARVVVPRLPHHVSQRGNRREPVFFGAEDYQLYRRLIAMAAQRAGAEIWAYCLMPNHVHPIVTPADSNGLRRTFGRSAPPLRRGHQRAGSAGPAIFSRVALARW